MLAHALTLNKELSEEEADVLAQIALQYMARNLLNAAKELGLKVTIELKPNKPLASGDATPVVGIRRVRVLNDKGAYPAPKPADVKRVLNAVLNPMDLAHVLFDAQQQLKKQVDQLQDQ
jgi:hypothetical protein